MAYVLSLSCTFFLTPCTVLSTSLVLVLVMYFSTPDVRPTFRRSLPMPSSSRR
jgi:hypothetical protein